MSRNTVDAGRLKIQAPEFGFDVEDGGLQLYNTLHNIFTFIGDNTTVRWYSFSLNANGFSGDSVTLIHNFDTSFEKLKITFTQNGNILSSSQVQSLLNISSQNSNSIIVQNLSNNNIQLHCYIAAIKGRITSDDFDADYYDQIVERTKSQIITNKSVQNFKFISQVAETNLPNNTIALANVGDKLTESFTRDNKNMILDIATSVDFFAVRNFVLNPKAEYLLNSDIILGNDANPIAFASSNVLVDKTAFVFIPKSIKTQDTYVRFLLKQIDPFYSDKTLTFSCKTYTTVANKYKIKLVNITDNIVVSGTENIIDSGYQFIKIDLTSYLNPAKSYAIQIEQLTDGATGELYFNDIFVGDMTSFSSSSGGNNQLIDDSITLSNGAKARIRNPYIAKTSQAKVQLSAYGSNLAQIANDYKASGYHAVVFTPINSLPTLPSVSGIVVAYGSKYTYDFANIYQFFGNIPKNNSIYDLTNAVKYYDSQSIATVDTNSIGNHLINDSKFTMGTLALDIGTINKLVQSGNWIYTYDDYDGIDSNKFNKRWVQVFVNNFTSESEIKANIKNGNCYISTGVILNSIEIVNKKIISIVANEQCVFNVYSDGELVYQTTALSLQYDISDFSRSYYIVQAINASNQVAWTQPFYIERTDAIVSTEIKPINKNRSFTHPSIFNTNEIDIGVNFSNGTQCQIFPYWYYTLSNGATKFRIENKSELKITTPSSNVTQLILLNRTIISGDNLTFSTCIELKKESNFTSGALELIIIATYIDSTISIATRTITAQELTSDYRQFTLNITTTKNKQIKYIECGIRFASGNLPNTNAVIYIRNVCLYKAFVINKFAEYDYPTYDREIPSGKNLLLNASFEYRPIQDIRDLTIQNHPLAIWTTVPFCYGFVKPNSSRYITTIPSPGVFSAVHESVNEGTYGNGYYNMIPSHYAKGFLVSDLFYYRAKHTINGASSGALTYDSACSLVFKYNSNSIDGISRGSSYTASLSFDMEFSNEKFEFTVPVFLLMKAFTEIWRGIGIELYLRASNPVTQNISSIYADGVQYIFDGNYYLPRFVSVNEGRKEASLVYETSLPYNIKTWSTGTGPNTSLQNVCTLALRTGNSTIYVTMEKIFTNEKPIDNPSGFSIFTTDRGVTNAVLEYTPGNFVSRSASVSKLLRTGLCEISCSTSAISLIGFNWEYDRC